MHHRRAIHLIIEKIPLLIAAVGACVVTYTVQKRAVGAIPPLPLLWRAENAVASYVIYIWKTVWPARLAVFYPHPNNGLALWAVCVAAAFLLAVTLAVIVVRRERPYLFTGWFWYLGMLLPVIGLIQVGEQGHADRYTYLPHIGLFAYQQPAGSPGFPIYTSCSEAIPPFDTPARPALRPQLRFGN